MGNTFGSTDGVGEGLGRIVHFKVDKNLTLTSWNAECEEVFGRRAADVVGGPIHSAVPSDNRDKVPSLPTRLPPTSFSKPFPGGWCREGVQPPLQQAGSRCWEGKLVFIPATLPPVHTHTTRTESPGAASLPCYLSLASTRICNQKNRRGAGLALPHSY